VRDDVRVVRRTLALLGVLLAVASAAGCGTASPISRPAGVDELVVPTPSIAPADYVAGIDNPWLPYAPGATWTYDVAGERSGTLTVTVREETVDVAGVAATAVDRTDVDGTVTTDLYAEDRRGNVWWLGREGVWRAGEDGAEAGLAMPATPRVGDGWRPAYAAGTVEDVATVEELDGETTVPAGTFGGLLVIETTTGLDPTADRLSYYAEGAGLVREVATEGATYAAALVTAPGAPGAG
jgi:hypothetical protein